MKLLYYSYLRLVFFRITISCAHKNLPHNKTTLSWSKKAISIFYYKPKKQNRVLVGILIAMLIENIECHNLSWLVVAYLSCLLEIYPAVKKFGSSGISVWS